MTNRFYIVLASLLGLLFTQPYELCGQTVDSVFSCGTIFLDSGGTNGNYESNQDQVTVFCPDNNSTGMLRLSFYALDIGQGDRLEVFDGLDTNARRLDLLNNRDVEPPYVYQASALNTSGCLTVRFRSDDQIEGQGWEATTSCIDSCQTIIAEIRGTEPNTFDEYIDICPGENVLFFGDAQFPENNTFYDHSNENSTYNWDFGDGTYATGQTVSHQFLNPGGYLVQLTVRDPFGCENTNRVFKKVRVSSPPEFTFAVPEFGPICIGDTVTLNSSLDDPTSNTLINVSPGSNSFSDVQYQNVNQTIPDGTPMALESELLLSQFGPGQTLQDPSDLERISIDIEHSRLQDLDVIIECPNGQRAALQNNIGFTLTPAFLGSPIIGDEGRVQPGRPATYLWEDDITLDTWEEVVTSTFPITLPAGTYQPEESFANLQGCPLNGTWKLIVRDTFVTSNGYLFSWNMDFRTDLYPALERYTTPVVLQEFVFDPTMAFYFPDSVLAAPEEAGYKYYQLEVTDQNSCKSDTTFRVGVLPETSPQCTNCDSRFEEIRDTFICRGDELQLSIQGAIPSSLSLTFESDPKYRLGFANHPPENPYGAQVLVQDVAQQTLTNPIAQIESICLNINSDFNEDLAVFLKAPNGQFLELTTNNGGGFDNYQNTCFEPSAPNPIATGSAPFNGSFAPEGSWSDLRGAPINGVWELVISDAFDLKNFGEVIDWEITFRSENELNIVWSPAAGLSCTDCVDPVASPTTTTDYNVQFVDGYGCTFNDNFRITVLDTFAAPEIICGPLSPGNMIFNWTSIGPNLTYDAVVNINGVDSILPDPVADTFLIVPGLVFGDQVSLQLSVTPPDTLYPCFIGVGESTCVFEDCFTFTRIQNVVDVNCFGDSTGAVTLEALRGFRPFTYYLNGDFIGQQDSIFTGLVAGDYEVVTEDMTGCSDTLFFTINQPEPIVANLNQLTTIACFGDSTASISAMPNGGTGLLNLNWNYPADSLTFLDSLPTGNYILTISDELNCQITDSIVVAQPAEIDIQAMVMPISCSNLTDGQINVSLTGGTGDLDFSWDSGINDTLLINLEQGDYTIRVEDENACLRSETYTIIEPLPLQIDTVFYESVSCFGRSNGEAEVFVSGGTLPFDYSWLDSLSQRNSRATNLPGGPVDILIMDARNCQISQTLNIPEPDSLAINFSSEEVSCLGGSDASSVALVAGGTKPYAYVWQDGTQDSTIMGLAAGSYDVTVTDVNACREVATVQLGEPDTELVLSVVQTDDGCFGAQLNEATVIPSGGGASAYQYIWSDGQTTSTAVGLDSVSYSVSVTDANGCEQMITINLVDLPEMNPNMIINQPSCFGESDGAIGINFIEGRENADLNFFQFLWNTGQRGPTINNLVGDSLYTVTVTDPNGCEAIESRLVRQPKLITFQLEAEPASCFNGADGNIEVSNISADSDNFTFLWDQRANNQATARADGLSAGIYTVTISDNLGCFNIGQATVRQPDQIQVEFKKVDNTCFGDQNGAISAAATGGTPAFRYAWSNGRTGPDLNNITAGNYTVTVTDNNNCFQEKSVEVEQPDPLDVSVESQDVNCFGDLDGSLVVSTNGGAPPYQYRLNQGPLTGSPIQIGLGAGEYIISILDANGCNTVTSAMITEPPAIEVDAGPDEYRIALGDSVTLMASGANNQGPINFEWIEPFPGAVPCLICEEITVKPTFTTSYELIGYDSAGCQANDFVRIFIDKEQIVAVPTGFSPNGDGRNDELILHGKPNTLIHAFRVYDRLGELVYQVVDQNLGDIQNGWDGLFNNEPAAQDTYIWYIEATFDNQVRKIFRGQTTLIR